MPVVKTPGTPVGFTSSASVNCPYPSSAGGNFAGGDMLYCFIAIRSSTITVNSVGAGAFTKKAHWTTANSSLIRMELWTRRATGTETGNVAIALSASTHGEAVIIPVTNVTPSGSSSDAIGAFAAGGADTGTWAAASPLSAPAVTTTAANSGVFAFFASSSTNSGVNFSTYTGTPTTEIVDLNNAAGSSSQRMAMAVAYGTKSVAGNAGAAGAAVAPTNSAGYGLQIEILDGTPPESHSGTAAVTGHASITVAGQKTYEQQAQRLYLLNVASDAIPPLPTTDLVSNKWSDVSAMSPAMPTGPMTYAEYTKGQNGPAARVGMARFAIGPLKGNEQSDPTQRSFLKIKSGFGFVFAGQQPTGLSRLNRGLRVYRYRPSDASKVFAWGDSVIDASFTGTTHHVYRVFDEGSNSDIIANIEFPGFGISLAQTWAVSGWGKFVPDGSPLTGNGYMEQPNGASTFSGTDLATSDFVDGDYLVVEICGYDDAMEVNAPANTMRFGWGGTSTSDATDLASYIEFIDGQLITQPIDKSGTVITTGRGIITTTGDNPQDSTILVTGRAAIEVHGFANVFGTTTIRGRGVINAKGPVDTETQIIQSLEFAAFGGADPWMTWSNSTGDKGVIARPGDAYIGRPKDINQGDRVFFRVQKSAVEARSSGGQVGRATLFITPVKVMNFRYADNPNYTVVPYTAVTQPSGDMFVVKRVDTALDLATCTPEAALAATLSGSYGTFPAVPTWLAGQMHYDMQTRGKSVDPISVDITALYNDALTRGVDLTFALECTFSSSEWVTELFGTERVDFQPRIEVARYEDTALQLIDLDTPSPKLTITLPAGATIGDFRWGYDDAYSNPPGNLRWMRAATGDVIENWEGRKPIANPYRFPMLESASRVWLQVEVDYGAGHTPRTLKFRRTFATLKTPKPLTELRTGTPGTYTWLAFRGPTRMPSGPGFDRWVAVVKTDVDTWKLFHCSDWARNSGEPEAYRWLEATNGVPDGYVMSSWPVGGGGVLVTAADCSPPWFDPTNTQTWFLSAHLVGGQYEVRLNRVWWDNPSLTAMGANAPAVVGGHNQSATIYTTTGGVCPDLSKAAVTRTLDWRSTWEQGSYWDPLLIAFVADGTLRVVRNNAWSSNRGSTVNQAGWAAEIVEGCGAPLSLEFLHSLSRNRVHRTVLALRTATDTKIWSRTDGDITFLDGGGYTVSNGAWLVGTYATGPTNGVFVTEPALSDCNTEVPDQYTVAIGVMLTSGNITWKNPHDLSSDPPQTEIAPFDFDGDGGYGGLGVAHTYNKWMVERYPTPGQVLMHTAHGGAVIFGASGNTLTAQRVRDFCKVSDITNLDTGAAVSEIHVCEAGGAREEQAIPVMIGSSGSYRCVTVVPGIDIARVDAPTDDQKAYFTSGSLTITDIDATFSTNAQAEGLHQLTGHNTFALQYRVNPGFQSVPSTANGIMDNFSTPYFCVRNVGGRSLKLHIHGVAGSKGTWIDGEFKLGADAFDGVVEFQGGREWPFSLHRPFVYTADPPTKANRRWHTIHETDWVFDGESGGGTLVIRTPTFPSEVTEVYIAQDALYDLDSFKADVAEWKATNPGLVHFCGPNGELLWEEEPLTYLSEAVIHGTRPLTTWEWEPYWGAPGDEFVGVLVSNPAYSKANKRLIIMQGQDDPGETTGNPFVCQVVRLLIAGTAQAARLLRAFDFLYFPFVAQSTTREGYERYSPDRFYYEVEGDYSYNDSEGTAQTIHGMPGQAIWLPPGSGYSPLGYQLTSAWNGRAYCAGESAVKAWQRHWCESHPNWNPANPVLSESELIAQIVSIHCDTHERPVSAKLFPRGEVGIGEWPITLFEPGFREHTPPQLISPARALSVSGANPPGNINATTQEMTREIAWGTQPSHKAGTRWEKDLVEQMAQGYLDGLVEVSAEDFEGSVIFDARGVITVQGEMGAEGGAIVTGRATITVTGERGVNFAGSGAISVTGDKIITGAAQGALSGAGVITATGIKVVPSAVALSGAGTVTEQAEKIALTQTTFTGLGTVTVLGQVIGRAVVLDGTAAFSGLGTISETAKKIALGQAALTGQGTIAAAGQVVLHAQYTNDVLDTAVVVTTPVAVRTAVSSYLDTAISQDSSTSRATLVALFRDVALSSDLIVSAVEKAGTVAFYDFAIATDWITTVLESHRDVLDVARVVDSYSTEVSFISDCIVVATIIVGSARNGIGIVIPVFDVAVGVPAPISALAVSNSVPDAATTTDSVVAGIDTPAVSYTIAVAFDDIHSVLEVFSEEVVVYDEAHAHHEVFTVSSIGASVLDSAKGKDHVTSLVQRKQKASSNNPPPTPFGWAVKE